MKINRHSRRKIKKFFRENNSIAKFRYDADGEIVQVFRPYPHLYAATPNKDPLIILPADKVLGFWLGGDRQKLWRYVETSLILVG